MSGWSGLVREAFGPMPAKRTVVARLKLLGAILVLWGMLASLVVAHAWIAR